MKRINRIWDKEVESNENEEEGMVREGYGIGSEDGRGCRRQFGMIEPIDESRKPKVSAEFQLVYFFIITNSRVPYIEPGFYDILGIAYIFSSPHLMLVKEAKGNPLIFIFYTQIRSHIWSILICFS